MKEQIWVYCVVKFKSVFDEPLPLLYEYSQLVRSSDGSLLKSPRKNRNNLTFPHQFFHTRRINSPKSQQPSNQSCKRNHKHLPTCEGLHLRNRSLIRSHCDYCTGSKYAMRMHSIQASFIWCYLFLINRLELFHTSIGLEHSIHRIDVLLTPGHLTLHYHEEQVECYRRNVQGKKGIEHVKRCDVHADERKLETDKGKYRLVFSKVVTLCC